MKVLVISARIGAKCENKVVSQNGANVTFICLDKDNYPTRERAMTARMVGKIPKMLAWELYPGYDVYIWMDSYFKMTRSDTVQWFISQLDGVDALFFKHPNRNSIKIESQFMITEMNRKNQYILDRCKGENMEAQVKHYLKDTNFIDNTLIAASAFAYKSSLVEDRRYNLMKEWYYEVCRWNVRDQISLPYLLYKMNINYKLSTENVFNLKYLK